VSLGDDDSEVNIVELQYKQVKLSSEVRYPISVKFVNTDNKPLSYIIWKFS